MQQGRPFIILYPLFYTLTSGNMLSTNFVSVDPSGYRPISESWNLREPLVGNISRLGLWRMDLDTNIKRRHLLNHQSYPKSMTIIYFYYFMYLKMYNFVLFSVQSAPFHGGVEPKGNKIYQIFGNKCIYFMVLCTKVYLHHYAYNFKLIYSKRININP